MANFFDQFDSAEPSTSGQSQNARAIAGIESGGNYRAVGPTTRNGDRALGKYQVMSANVGPWSKEVFGQEITPTQFMASPELQDKLFEAKFGSYVEKYGPEGAAKAWFAGEGGMNDPNRKDALGTTVASYANKFTSALGPGSASAGPLKEDLNAKPMRLVIGNQANTVPRPKPVSEAPLPPPGVNFFDQFDAAPTVAERSDMGAPPENAAALQAGLLAKADQMTTGPATSPMQQASAEMNNLVPTASQGTNPNADRYSGKLISKDAFESDSGEILYRDSATGTVKPTDTKTQVAIRDPRDNTVKIFERSEATNEGPAVGVARVLAPGLAAGAPTARPLALKAAQTPGQEAARAAKELGVDVPRAITTDSMAAQRTASAVRNIPLAGDPLVTASSKAIEQLGQKADEVARGYGSGTVVGSGDAAKGAITNYVTGVTKQRATKLYDAVDSLVDDSKVVPLTSTKGVAGEILARRGNAALGPDSKAIGTVQEAIDRPGLTYSGIKDLRTAIGEMMNKGILPEGMSQGELKQIYAAISNDLKATVSVAGGTKAAAAFERANKYYSLVSGRRESLAKIIGAAGDAPAERVFDRLVGMASSTSRADISKLAQARKAIGSDDWNEFASGVISQMGRSPAIKGGPESLQGIDFSPERFLTSYNKLSKEGRQLLFRSGGNGDLARSLDQIATVSSRFRELQKFANPSGTAQNITGAGLAATAAGAAFAGDFITPLKIIGGVIGGRAMASVLAKPATASAIASFSTKYEQALRVPTAPRIALLSMASKNLATNLKDAGITVSVQDFLKAIQSPAKSAAEDEQQPVPRGPR